MRDRPRLSGDASVRRLRDVHPGRRGSIRLMPPTGWKRQFDDPIPLPRGRQLVTLEDAGKYITRLPKAEHTMPEWQAAMEALILVATSGGPTIFARIGVMRALNRNVERVLDPSRKRSPLGAPQA